MLKITTGDGKTVEVDQKFRQMSKLVEEALLDSADEVATMTAADVNEKELKMIVAYCEHHKFEKTSSDIEHPLPSKDPKVFIKDDHDREFMEKLDLDG